MYTIACVLDLPPDIATKVRNPREFPLSNLDRIYRNSEVTKFLGINFDENRQLKGCIDPKEFIKGYNKVVTDVALGRVDSRTLNSSEDFNKYLKSFGEATPDRTKKGSFTGEQLTKTAPPKGLSTARKLPTPPSKQPRPQTALIAKTFVTDCTEVRINGLIRELKRISVADYPNAVALAMRGLVDLVVGSYSDRIGATERIIERARNKDNKPIDWYPSVRQMLQYMVSESNSLKLHPLALKAAKMLVADNKPVTVLTLDAFAHNKYVTPTEGELRSFWTQIEEAMKVMLAPTPIPDAGS